MNVDVFPIENGDFLLACTKCSNPYDIPLYWLVHSDPHIGLLQSKYIYKWLV